MMAVSENQLEPGDVTNDGMITGTLETGTEKRTEVMVIGTKSVNEIMDTPRTESPVALLPHPPDPPAMVLDEIRVLPLPTLLVNAHVRVMVRMMNMRRKRRERTKRWRKR